VRGCWNTGIEKAGEVLLCGQLSQRKEPLLRDDLFTIRMGLKKPKENRETKQTIRKDGKAGQKQHTERRDQGEVGRVDLQRTGLQPQIR
jgi:hypothetical protein